MVSFILAPVKPLNFKVSTNNVSQQLSLSWEVPRSTIGQILFYQYCYVKVNNSNRMCDNTTGNSTNLVNIPKLG